VNRRSIVAGACVMACLVGSTRAATAQRVSLSPTIGVYIPTSELEKAGASLVKKGGEAYESLEDKTDVGGVVGATVGFNLGSFLSFYIAAEDYIYGTTLVQTGTLEEKKTQNDVQLAVGFGVPLNK
jgi:hypothetical protein